MTDIRVDDDWQLTRAANGDAPAISGNEEFLQSIKLESMTQEGDLFYDLEYGWSLLDFIHSTDSELTRTAIQERIQGKMSKRPEIDITTLQVNVSFRDDVYHAGIQFKNKNNDSHALIIALDRVRMEVVTE